MLDNIRLGRPGASDDDIDRLVDRLGITNIVTHLENGIDTVVGVNGATLSGGERQLIGICRAMLRNAPIVLLDESTAALDTTTDAAISYSLQELARGRTVIVIAHRLSTLRYVDRVIYMDAGCIVGMDSHDELHRSIVPYRILCSEYLHLPGSSVQSAVRSTPEVVLS